MGVLGRRLALVATLLLVLSGCSAIPNMDSTGSGCANRSGSGPRDQGEDPTGIPLAGISGLIPVDAVAAAEKTGNVVVFRLNSMACVCTPPPGYGPVREGWWASRGQLYVDLQDVIPQGPPLADGTDCPSVWSL